MASIDWAEAQTREFVLGLNEKVAITPLPSLEAIRAEARATFERQLEDQLRALQDGETLQLTMRVDIITSEGKVRSGGDNQRTSPEYEAWRQAVMERDGYRCQDCGAKGDLRAHHIKPWATHPAERFVLDNGLTLCPEHHAARHPHLNFYRKSAEN